MTEGPFRSAEIVVRSIEYPDVVLFIPPCFLSLLLLFATVCWSSLSLSLLRVFGNFPATGHCFFPLTPFLTSLSFYHRPDCNRFAIVSGGSAWSPDVIAPPCLLYFFPFAVRHLPTALYEYKTSFIFFVTRRFFLRCSSAFKVSWVELLIFTDPTTDFRFFSPPSRDSGGPAQHGFPRTISKLFFSTPLPLFIFIILTGSRQAFRGLF